MIGVTLAVLLTFVVRPLLVGLLLLPVRLGRGERLFVVWVGLKGAVPILLASFLLTAGEPDATRLYGVIFVVVAFLVVVQGGLVPVAARLKVPMRTIEPEPWTLGVRFRREPRRLRRQLVAAGSPADGCTIEELAVGEDAWISLVIRDGQLVPVTGATTLCARRRGPGAHRSRTHPRPHAGTHRQAGPARRRPHALLAGHQVARSAQNAATRQPAGNGARIV
jgi:cell volume regulation protein A